MNEIGIYIHIPFCKIKCGYCSFVSGTDFSSQKIYIDRLLHEFEERLNGENVDTVYIGGGTPSTLFSGALDRIFSVLRNKCNIVADAEITVECNPESTSQEFIAECKRNGVNRISLGLQSTENKLLKFVGRPHSYEDFLTAFNIVKSNGIDNISVDLMMGLPKQTLRDMEKTIDKVLSLPLKHISIYSLKVEEGTPLYELGFICDEDLEVDMYDMCYEKLNKALFIRYEVSNFCLEGYKSRHNFKYWDMSPYMGFGAAAHSYNNKIRYENTSNVSKYILGEKPNKYEISISEQKIEFIMLALRTSTGIDLCKYKSTFNEDLSLTKQKEIEQLINDSFIEIDDCLRLKNDAFYIMNSIIMKLI